MTPHKAWPSSPWHLRVFRAYRDAAVFSCNQVDVRSTGKGVFKSDTKDSYLLDCLHVRMDWRVIMDFDRALMNDRLT